MRTPRCGMVVSYIYSNAVQISVRPVQVLSGNMADAAIGVHIFERRSKIRTPLKHVK